MRDEAAYIRARLGESAAARNGAVFRAVRDGYEIVVLKDGAEVQLFFAAPRGPDGALVLSGVMSRLDVREPLALLGDYTQAMLLSLLWRPAPVRVFAAGFGGGRVPLVLHHLFADVVIDGAELDPMVIDLAARFFGVAYDARMRVVAEDAAIALRAAQPGYDIILIDCYNADAAAPDQFAASPFYDLCKARLAPGGIVVSNLDTEDPALAAKCAVFKAAFPCAMQMNNGVAHVLFGADQPPDLGLLDALAARTRAIAPLRRLVEYLEPL